MDRNNHELSSSDPPSPTSIKRARRSIVVYPNQSLEDQTVSSTIGDTAAEQLGTQVERKYDVVNITPSDQVSQIQQLIKYCAKKPGETWYMVSTKWIAKWTSYCKSIAEHQEQDSRIFPGPVDNRSLLDDEYHLLPNLIERKNYICMPILAWLSLEKWYSTSKTSIPRRVIYNGPHSHEGVLEIYPPEFKVLLASKDYNLVSLANKAPTIYMSEDKLLQEANQILLDAVGLDIDTGLVLCLSDSDPPQSTFDTSYYFSSHIYSLILHHAEMASDNASQTIGNFCTPGDTIVMILSDVFCKPTDIDTSSNNSSTSSTPCTFGSDFRKDTMVSNPPPISTPFTTSESPNIYPNDDSVKAYHSWTTNSPLYPQQCGLGGLLNIGNTCYMNSALQCLSNTAQLSQWFLFGKYENDLNRSNPLGMNGEIAESYGQLIKEMWNDNITSVDPGGFKRTICRFNPSFTGYQQHDSQELLTFLLDGLHEDTNRILKKPYIEMPTFDGMTDEQISKASWDYHKARNDSIIVDLFQGQFKSRLACNDCQQVSVTFDPFMYLSLPLPIQKKRKIETVFVPYDPTIIAQRMIITLDKDTYFEQFKASVAKQANVADPSTLLILEIYINLIYKVFYDYEPIASVKSNDLIYVYELPGPVSPIRSSPKLNAYSQLVASSILDSGDNYLSDHDNKNLGGKTWIVFPVYCSTLPRFGRRDSNEQFGAPVLLAIQPEDATCPENLYRLIAKHMERYTIKRLFEAPQRSQISATSCPPTPISPYSPPARKYSGMLDQQQHSEYVRPPSTPPPSSGTQLDPISNLFSMKIFTGYKYVDEPESIIPINSGNWISAELTDIQDRVVRIRDQAQDNNEYHQNAYASDHDNSIFQQDPTDSTEIATGHYETRQKSNLSSPKRMEPHINMQEPSLILSPPQPSAEEVRPPTVITQGEGILLEWQWSKAQTYFGTDISPLTSYNDSTNLGEINEDSWMTIKEVCGISVESDQLEQPMTLISCLDEFTKKEHLSAQDQWYCPQCKQHRRATKKFDLCRLPEILVIHLKRFGHTTSLHDKIDNLIDFPIDELDMTDRVIGLQNADTLPPEDRFIYDLYAVDNHVGSLCGGHYTAFAQNWHDDLWYHFDDTHIVQVDKNETMTSAAYLLFYKRRR